MNFISLLLKNFKKEKYIHHSSFRRVDLADMQSLSRYNKRIKYLLSAIDFFKKYAWVIPMKDSMKNENEKKY